MSKRRIVSWCLAAVFAGVLGSGCAKPPTEAMQAAQEKMDKARTDQVDLYSPEGYKRVEDTFNDAKSKMDAKDYNEARKGFELAMALVDSAKIDADARKAGMEVDAKKAVAELPTMWGDVNAAVAKAKGEAGKALREENGQMVEKINSLQALVDSTKYADAMKIVEEAKIKAEDFKARAASAK